MLNLRGSASLSNAILNGLINLSISSVLSVFIKVGLTQMLFDIKSSTTIGLTIPMLICGDSFLINYGYYYPVIIKYKLK
jgi:hypothetical protein